MVAVFIIVFVLFLLVGCLMKFKGNLEDYSMTPSELWQYLRQRFASLRSRRRRGREGSEDSFAVTASTTSSATLQEDNNSPPRYDEVVTTQNERNSEPPPPYAPPYIISPPSYDEVAVRWTRRAISRKRQKQCNWARMSQLRTVNALISA